MLSFKHQTQGRKETRRPPQPATTPKGAGGDPEGNQITTTRCSHLHQKSPLRVDSSNTMAQVNQSRSDSLQVAGGGGATSCKIDGLSLKGVHVGELIRSLSRNVGGGVRIHPENAHMSGRHWVQYVAQCVACAALTPDVWQ